ncbi:Mechanosensitive ion channel protein 10 [Dictyocoela muelleri]|nr:Mechanosensitive ion channel protein 10 [Dictyocoela muelleri]
MNYTEQTFNWYEDAADVDIDEFEPVDKERYKISYYFDLTLSIFRYITAISFFILLFRYAFNQKNYLIEGIRLNTILFYSIVFFGSLIIITMLMESLLFILKMIGAVLIEKRFKIFYRWASMAIWFTLNLYFLNNFLKEEMGDYYKYLRSFLLSGILTSISFTGESILMQLFYESFVAKSLDAKMKDVDLKERIIAVMKAYRYEISDSTPSESEKCACADIFCMNESNGESEDRGSHIDINAKNEVSVGGLYFKPPEMATLYDAKTLSRDVFSKASKDGNELTFNDFQQIFPNTQIALQAFAYFDVDNAKSITRKEFRDTIISFYIDRINLEKGFEIAKGFVDIINDMVSVVVGGFLCLAYLVIFGVSLKDLLALALSSALVLNFAVSGMAVDLYFNFIVLLSHPFDIGDDVIIDGVDYTVYQIGLNSTSFLGKNGGKVKFINSVLWKKSLINMTRAPEKVIMFNFKLDSNIEIDKFRDLKSKIHHYLKQRPFDFYESFSLEANSENSTDIKTLDCCLVLKCKSYKNKGKKFHLRTEFNYFLRKMFEELEIKEK